VRSVEHRLAAIEKALADRPPEPAADPQRLDRLLLIAQHCAMPTGQLDVDGAGEADPGPDYHRVSDLTPGQRWARIKSICSGIESRRGTA
jgi:hypothetical protein